MKPEDKKYIWWGLLGIGVAALFYFLSAKNQSQQANTVTVPYLVPQTSTGASPTANQSLSTQSNIIGSSSNSTVPNYSNPYSVATNPFETPGSYGYMPMLSANLPYGVNNAVTFGAFNGSGGATSSPAGASGGIWNGPISTVWVHNPQTGTNQPITV